MPHSSESQTSARGDVRIADSDELARTSRGLKRIARSIVGDDATADDVVQSVWIAALERRATTQGLGWLRRVTRNRAVDALRRKKRRRHRVDTGLIESLEGSEDPLAHAVDVGRMVLEAVDKLGEPYRSTVYLRYFESQGPQAIAQRLGVPEKTVATRLTRAHAQLRARLRAQFDDESGAWSPALLGLAATPCASPASSSTPSALTLMLMKKTILACALAVIALLGWRALDRPLDRVTEGSTAHRSATESNDHGFNGGRRRADCRFGSTRRPHSGIRVDREG